MTPRSHLRPRPVAARLPTTVPDLTAGLVPAVSARSDRSTIAGHVTVSAAHQEAGRRVVVCSPWSAPPPSRIAETGFSTSGPDRRVAVERRGRPLAGSSWIGFGGNSSRCRRQARMPSRTRCSSSRWCRLHGDRSCRSWGHADDGRACLHPPGQPIIEVSARDRVASCPDMSGC